jgi:flagella synthesis protein FlgN
LLSEQEILRRGDADKLPPLSDKKSALAERLGALLKSRESALVQGGHTGNREGMELWLGASHPNPLRDQWSRLLQLATTARAQQEVNGKLIAIQMQHTQQALTALMTASGRPLTYGPDGQQRLGGGGRNLGSA